MINLIKNNIRKNKIRKNISKNKNNFNIFPK